MSVMNGVSYRIRSNLSIQLLEITVLVSDSEASKGTMDLRCCHPKTATFPQIPKRLALSFSDCEAKRSPNYWASHILHGNLEVLEFWFLWILSTLRSQCSLRGS